jgi:hypothetical protein
VDHLKKIALRGTSIGIAEATVERARGTGIKAGLRLAILCKAETWLALLERVVETGRGRGILVDVTVGSVTVDEKLMMLDGQAREETGDQREDLVVETGMAGRILDATSVETVVDERTEEESDAPVRK